MPPSHELESAAWLADHDLEPSAPAHYTPAPAMAAALTLSSVRRTCQRLWNNVHISADQKRLASAYYARNVDDVHQLHRLNRRMSELITAGTPAHQRPA